MSLSVPGMYSIVSPDAADAAYAAFAGVTDGPIDAASTLSDATAMPDFRVMVRDPPPKGEARGLASPLLVY